MIEVTAADAIMSLTIACLAGLSWFLSNLIRGLRERILIIERKLDDGGIY